MIKINIQEYRASGSKIFSGREQGKKARQKLDLNKKDFDQEKYEIIIPDDTYSITGSFFGGMFSDSVINLKEEKFRDKYKFRFSNGELSEILQNDIDEGIYDAANEL